VSQAAGAGLCIAFAVGEHVPDGVQDGVFEGDERLRSAGSGRCALVLCGQVGVLAPCGRYGRYADSCFEVYVAGQDVGGFDPSG